MEVNLPTLSADANHRLTEELRAVIGADTVRVPADRARPSQGERPKAGPMDKMTNWTVITVGLVAVGVCVGLIILTALGGHWILTALAFVVLLVSLFLVTMSIIALASVTEYPDPGLVALLSEQGMLDPEIRFSEIVKEFIPDVEEGEERPTDVLDDPAQAIAEQQGALTGTGHPTSSGAEDS